MRVKLNNSQVVKFYNDNVIIAVNDSLVRSAEWLASFADYIDNSTVHMVNLTNSSSSLVLSNSGRYFTRIWLKNQQNDSIPVLVRRVLIKTRCNWSLRIRRFSPGLSNNR